MTSLMQCRFPIPVSVLVLMVTVFGQVPFVEAMQWTEESILAECAIFEAGRINNEAIRAGDYISRKVRTLDTIGTDDRINEDGVLEVEEERSRLIFDAEKKRFVVFKAEMKEQTDLGKALQGELGFTWRRGLILHGSLDGSGNISLTIFPGETRKLHRDVTSEKGLADALQFIQFPGIGQGPGGTYDSYLAGHNFHDSIRAGNTQIITFRTPVVVQGNDRFFSDYEFTFDLTTLMSVQNRVVGYKVDSGLPPRVGLETKREWEERNGVFLVKRTAIERAFRDNINGRVVKGTEFTDIETHWFKLNEEVTEKDFVFDGEITEEFVVRMTDPTANNAWFASSREKSAR